MASLLKNYWLCTCGLRFNFPKCRYLGNGFNLGAWSPWAPSEVNGERKAALESQADLSKIEALLGEVSLATKALRFLLSAPGRCAELGRRGSRLLKVKTELFCAIICFSPEVGSGMLVAH